MAEDEGSKLDRELMELLQELRVVLPGVQVLFAFLLGLPFTQRFGVLDEVQRDVYFAAFIATAVSTICLITPTAYHRLRWRQYDKERLLTTSNRMTLAGVTLLGIAVGLVVYLITDVLFSGALAIAAACAVTVLVAAFWFVVPLSRRLTDGQ